MHFHKCIKFLFIISLFLIVKKANATHGIGGQFTYRHINKDSFEIKLTVLVDCLNGINAIKGDSIISIYIFDIAGNLIKTVGIGRGFPTRINSAKYSCTKAPDNICTDKYDYTFNVKLPYSAGGYTVANSTCCRTNAVKNLINMYGGIGIGSIYWTHIPDSIQANGYNSSAVFENLPSTVICLGENYTFNHSATDIDGDSLAYELFTPFCNDSRTFPYPPPYTNVTWYPPYNISNIIDGNPTLSVNPITGILNIKPTNVGQYVIGILVKEYRNRTLINITRREFQFNVILCASRVQSLFADDLYFCNDTVHFSNFSAEATKYLWNFGVNNILSDTSNLKEPTFVFPGAGKYIIKLIVSDSICKDSSEKDLHLFSGQIKFAGTDTSICNGEQVVLGTNYINIFKYTWRPSIYLNDSTLPQPIAKPLDDIKYTATIKVNSICSIVDSVNVKIHKTKIDFNANMKGCSDTLILKNNSQFVNNYLWDFGVLNNNADTSTLFEPYYIYPKIGKYSIKLKAANGRCADSLIKEIINYNDHNRFAGNDVSICIGDSLNLGNTDTLGYTYQWNPSTFLNDSTLGQPTSKPKIKIKYNVVRNNGFCSNADSITISIKNINANFSLGLQQFCDGAFIILDSIKPYSEMKWFVNNNLINKDELLTTKYLNGNKNLVRLIVKDGFCIDSLEKEFTPINTDSIKLIPNVFSPNEDGINDCFYVDGIKLGKECKNSLLVFNRWGNLMFDSDTDGVCWNGLYDGKKVSEGVYFFILKTPKKNYHGTITLLR